MELTKECVVVLDWSPNCVHFFSKNGTFLSSCISQEEGQFCLADWPSFFCLDPAGNIIISDISHNVIKIFSKRGKHIHTIGKKGDARGEFIRPLGISISQLGTIYVVSNNPNYSLQCF